MDAYEKQRVMEEVRRLRETFANVPGHRGKRERIALSAAARLEELCAFDGKGWKP